MRVIEVPGEWGWLLGKVHAMRGTVMVIGAPDSGKTTLARFLVRELSHRGEPVAYIDGDMGQSMLGPPTTLGMAVWDGHLEDLEKAEPDAVYFVGSTSPRGHGLETLVGLKRLLERSRGGRDLFAIVDTTGYVTGRDALELKYQKIGLLAPRHIVAVQRHGEIEHILRTQEGRPGFLIHRLSSPAVVKTRSPEERRLYRLRRFREYFKTVRLHRVDLRGVSLTGFHRIKIQEGAEERLEGLLVGLNDPENFLVALGIIETLDRFKRILSCLVPSDADLERVQSVRLGSIRIDLSEETNGEHPLATE